MYLKVPWPLPTTRPSPSTTVQSAKNTDLPPPERRARATSRCPGWPVLMKLVVSERVTARRGVSPAGVRSEEHTSELQSLMRISYAVFCLKKKNILKHPHHS